MARPKKPAPIFDASGATGLEHSAGYIREELHPKLQGTQAIRVFKEMRDNDAVVGAILYAFEFLIRATSWKIEPRSESPSPEEQRIAEFCEQCREDMQSTWAEVLSEIVTFFWAGYSLLEKVYKIRGGQHESQIFRSNYADGLIGWRDLAPRSQESVQRWDIDDNGHVNGVWQLAAPKYKQVYIPSSKLLHFRIKSNKGNPEGRSLLRNAYRPWFFGKRLQEIEAVGIERNVAGLPVALLPPEMLHPNAKPEQKQAVADYEAMVSKIRLDQYSGLVFPAFETKEGKTGYDLKLLSSSGKSFADTDPVIRRWESRAALSVLAEFVLLGLDKVGSFALADSKTAMASLALGSAMDSICDVFNRDALPELVRLNGWDPRLAPRLSHGDIDQPDIMQLMNYVVAGVQSGAITPDAKLEAHLREYGGLAPREAMSVVREGSGGP